MTRVVVVEGQETVVTELVSPTATPASESEEAPRKPVTLDLSYLGDLPNIDPQTTTDPEGIDLVENLFVGLTNFNHATNTIEGELAESWDVSDDGRTWVFHLRDDIYWVRPNENKVKVDGLLQAETVRPVTASDVVYTVQRVCRRETNAPNAFILFLIDGCEQVYNTTDPTVADLAGIGAKAVDDVTLQFNLTKPAGYFLTITSMWPFHPVPQELVEEYGDQWLAPTDAALLTSGPFMPVSELKSGVQTVLHKNSTWPLIRPGNVDVVNITYFDESMPAYQLWQARSLDISPMPAEERQTIMEQSPQKVLFETEQTTFYLGFNFDSAAFQEPGVRRAFSAAIDREKLAEELFGGLALGMRHLSPPGVMAGPPIDQIGLGYSPDDARRLMAESSFGSCRAMPPITFLITSSDLSLRQAELIRDMWVEAGWAICCIVRMAVTGKIGLVLRWIISSARRQGRRIMRSGCCCIARLRICFLAGKALCRWRRFMCAVMKPWCSRGWNLHQLCLAGSSMIRTSLMW
ncbi:MAG: ABC transporter substrate-binding protein [Anaerolineae bacterium]